MGPAAGLLSPPAQRVPIYLGAMSPKMLMLGGELADGVLTLFFPPEHYQVARGHITRGHVQAHRPPDAVDIPACVWVSVAEDREAAESALARSWCTTAQRSTLLIEPVGLAREDFAPAAAAQQEGDSSRRAASSRRRCFASASPVRLRTSSTGAFPSSNKERPTYRSGRPLPGPLTAVDLLGQQVIPRLRATAAALS